MDEDGQHYTYGVMFEVTTFENTYMVIESFDFHTISNNIVTAVVQTREGSFLDDKSYNSFDWTIVSHSKIQGQGQGSTSTIPKTDFTPVYIPVMSSQSFYFTLMTSELICTYDKTTSVGDIWKQNEDFSFKVGSAINQYPFRGSYDVQSIWNGIIHYTTAPPSPAPSLYSFPTYPSTSPSSLQHKTPSEIDNKRKKSSPTDSPSTTVSSTSKCSKKGERISTDYALDIENLNFGNMFAVKTKYDNIIITGFDVVINTDEPIYFEIFTKKGSYYGSELERGDWTKVGSGQIIGTGEPQITSIPSKLFIPVTIQHQSFQSFYLSVNTRSLLFEEGVREGSAYIYNKYMDVLEGRTFTSSPFSGGNMLYPSRWHGNIHFDVIVSCFVSISSTYSTPPPSVQYIDTIPSTSPSKIIRSESISKITRSTAPSQTSLPTYDSSNTKDFITTKMVLNIAVAYKKSQKTSKVLDLIKMHMKYPLRAILINDSPLLFNASTHVPFILQPITLRVTSSIKISSTIQECNQTYTDNQCSSVGIAIAVSHSDNVSGEDIRTKVFNNAHEIFKGLKYPITYLGPWAVSESLIITIFVDKMTNVKRKKLFSIIESSVHNFLSIHLSKSWPYLTIRNVQAEDIPIPIKGENKRLRDHRNHAEDDRHFRSDLLVVISGLSRLKVDFPKAVKKICNDFIDELEVHLRNNSNSMILKASVSFTLNQTFPEKDQFGDDRNVPNDGNPTGGIFTSRVALMFYIETLVGCALLYICHRTQKARRKFLRNSVRSLHSVRNFYEEVITKVTVLFERGRNGSRISTKK